MALTMVLIHWWHLPAGSMEIEMVPIVDHSELSHFLRTCG